MMRSAARLCLLLLCACGAAEPHAAGSITLRYASPYSPMHPFSRADASWIKHVEAASGGRLRIAPFWSGALLSSDQSLVELRHGVSDVAVISPIYARGGAHALRTQAGFYAGATSFESQVAVYKCLAREFTGLGAELRGLEVLAVQGGNLPGIVTRSRPVPDVAALTGLRLRAPAELMDVLKTLGADPINMPMSDVYSALAKGVIDGVVVSPDALRAMHLAEVGRYFATLAIPRGAYPARAIAARSLARLPPDLQTLLRASSDTWEAALSEELARALTAGERYGREQGMQFVTWSRGEQQRFEAAYNAAARRSAGLLAARGVDGEAMFGRAQQWTERLRQRPTPEVARLPCF